MKPTKSKVTN